MPDEGDPEGDTRADTIGDEIVATLERHTPQFIFDQSFTITDWEDEPE